MDQNPSASDRFINRVLIPFPDGEARAAAERELRARLTEHAAGREAEVAELEARLARTDARPWLLRNWSRVLAWVMLAVCIPEPRRNKCRIQGLI